MPLGTQNSKQPRNRRIFFDQKKGLHGGTPNFGVSQKRGFHKKGLAAETFAPETGVNVPLPYVILPLRRASARGECAFNTTKGGERHIRQNDPFYITTLCDTSTCNVTDPTLLTEPSQSFSENAHSFHVCSDPFRSEACEKLDPLQNRKAPPQVR